MSFLRNCWYCISWSSDLGTQPIAIRVLGSYLVCYRDANGDPVILDGRCPHRFAPLDRGVVKGDTITCAYHGLQFAKDGACILNPHGNGFIPPQAILRAYPALERNRAVWVWMGDPALSDDSLIPIQNFIEDPTYACDTLTFKMNGNYQLVIDNLLDLTHAPYLHSSTLAVSPEKFDPLVHSFRVDGEFVHSDYHTDNMETAPNKRGLFDADSGAFDATMTWWPASCLRLDTFMTHHDGRPGLNFASVHFITPETETSSHYFTMFGRNVKIEDEYFTAAMRASSEKAFRQEDEPMIEACQDLMGTTDLFALHPAILKTDVAAVQARRILARRISAEHAAAAPPSALVAQD